MSEKDTPKIIEETQVTAKRKKSNKDIIIETLTEQNKKIIRNGRGYACKPSTY